jgi:Domain of unknown function (DUF4397)
MIINSGNRKKRQLYFLCGMLAAGLACNKDAATTARLLVVNGTHSLGALTVQWNGNPVNTTPLAPAQYSGTTGNAYTNITAGTNGIVVQNGATTLFDKNSYAAPGNRYTLLAYDTAKSVASTRLLYLSDDILAADTGTTNIRFLYLVPDTTAVDIILLRPVKNDTIFVNNRFIGKDAEEREVEVFAQKKEGDVTGIQINKTGTGVLLLNSGSFSFQKQAFYSIVYSGLTGATGNAAPKLTVIRH